MNEYKKMFEIIDDKEALDKYIEERLQYLKSEEYQKGRVRKTSGQGYSNGFFAEDEKITFGTLGFGYLINDDSIFQSLIDNLKMFKKETPEKEYQDLIVKSVRKTVSDYFENHDKEKNYEQYIEGLYGLFGKDKRWKAQLDFVREVYQGKMSEKDILYQIEIQAREWYPVYAAENKMSADICNIKGLGFAKCAEYAALTNQLFAFLGVPTCYVENQMADRSGAEGHAYNVVETDKGVFLIDCINSIFKKLPSKEFAQDLMEGKTTFSTTEGNVCYGQGAKVSTLEM